jgi:hypothetical protein
MKNQFILPTIFFFFAISAFASLEGKWHGWAYWKYQGQGPKCTAQMKFSETEEDFSLVSGHLDCDIVAMTIPDRTFQKIDGKLHDSEKEVGSYTENTYEWIERYNERTVIQVSIKVNGTNLDYSELWIQDESTTLYEISGRLFKSQK